MRIVRFGTAEQMPVRYSRSRGDRMDVRRIVLAACASLILALPRAPAAQTTDAQPAIGYLGPGSASGADAWIGWFKDELGRRGFVDGESVRLLTRHSDGNPDRLSFLARELVASGARVIVTRGT